MEGQYPFQPEIDEDTVLAKYLKMVGPIPEILVTTKNGKRLFLSKLGCQQTSLAAFGEPYLLGLRWS